MNPRVRIPTDRNLAAAARRAAITPDALLLRQYLHATPDMVEILPGGAPRRPVFRAYFRQPSGAAVCYIRPRMWAAGVRLPATGEVVMLRLYADYVNGIPPSERAYAVTVVQVADRFRSATVMLLPV